MPHYSYTATCMDWKGMVHTFDGVVEGSWSKEAKHNALVEAHRHAAIRELDSETVEVTDLRYVDNQFAKMSTSALVRRMERAPDFGYDDEATELTQRLEREGKIWRWAGSDIEIYTSNGADE
jgi:hypothetical protein